MKNFIKRIPLNKALWCVAICLLSLLVVSEVRGTDICEHNKYITQELEIATYRTEMDENGNYTRVPTYEDGSGWIFAGWYTDSNCATAVSSSITEGTYTAKFVPKHVLDVKAQVSANLCNSDVNDDTKASLRFVTSVDCLKYTKMGFEIVLTEGANPIINASNQVYKKLYAVGNEDEVMGYKPENLFCSLSTYFKACVIKNIPEAAYDKPITVTPFWITKDGTIVKSDPVSKSVRQGIADTEKVSITIEKSAHGTVVKEKETYFVGETVVLSGVGNEGYYCYGMTIDGKSVDLNMDGTFRFVARKDCTVKGEFDERIFVDNENWNILKQNQGVVYLPNGGGADKPLQFYKEYSDVEIKINAKNDPNGSDADEQSPRTDIMFEFEDEKFITFSVLRVNNKKVTIQSMGGDNSMTGWEEWYTLTDKEMEQYNSSEGIELRVVRIDNGFSVYVGDKLAAYKEISGGYKDATAKVYLRHWGDEGVNLDIPFEVVDKFATLSTKDTYSSEKFYVNENKLDAYTADPFILDNTGSDDPQYAYYYMYGTNSSTNFKCYRSKDMMNWEAVGDVLNLSTDEENNVVSADAWAPEVVYDSSTKKYYMFFSASPKKDAKEILSSETAKYLLFVAVSDYPDQGFKLVNFKDAASCGSDNVHKLSDNTLSPYSRYYAKYCMLDPEQYNSFADTIGCKDTDNHSFTSAIDPHPYVDTDGNKYLIWTDTWDDDCIIGVEMENWLKPKWDTAKVLTYADYYTVEDKKNNSDNMVDYENDEYNVNEGPVVVKRGTKYYLTFSMGAYFNDTYQVAQAVSDNILGPYRKLTEAEGGMLLSGTRTGSKNIFGTGHHSFVEIGEQLYIVYHRLVSLPEDADNANWQRYPVIDEVQWVKNKDGLEVMYVNGPTETIQPAIEEYSKYSNVADDVQVKGVENDYVNDGLLSINKNGNATFMEKIPETNINKTTAFTFDFEHKKEVGAIMIYNSKTEENCFENIAQIELICEEQGETVIHYIKDLAFSSDNYEKDSDGSISYVVPGSAAWAEFSDKTVKSVRIIVEVPEGKTVGISEIRILAKEYKANTTGKENGRVYFDANRLHVLPDDGYQAIVTIDGEEVHYTKGESVYVLPEESVEKTLNVAFSTIDESHDISKYVATINTGYYKSLEEAVLATENNDTMVLLKDVTVEKKMVVSNQITITNQGDVTITRGEGLYEVPEAFSIWPRGNMTIKGAEGTKFTITGGSEEAVNSRFAWVDGSLKLENVKVQDFNSQREGGAFVYNRGGSIEFNKSTFTNNTTVHNGAVVYNEAGTVNVIDSTFKNNIAKGNGGAIYNGDSGALNLTGEGTFENNTARGALVENNFGGGAICVGTGTLYVDGYSFVGNISEQVAGGAITLVSDGIECTIKNCQFDSNQSTVSSSEGSGGGAIMASMKTLNIEGTTFTNNTTNGIGGAICAFTGDLTVTSSTFGGDTAEAANSAHRGGAIYSGASADVTLNKVAEYTTEALFQNNKATDRGGAIAIGSGSLTVEGYSFTSNSCSNEGGAIHLATDPIACNVLKSTFTQNSAAKKGGAIFSNSTAQMKIDGGNFTGNTAFTGGAVYGNETAITVDKTQGIPVFSDNQTEGAGAVIRTDGSSNVTINGGTFSNNKVTGNEVGGVIYLPDPGTLTVNGGSFVENEAQWGGVLALYSTEGVTINAGVKFENNTARSDGGAIYVAKSDVELTVGKDVEFTTNSAGGAGGAICSYGSVVDNGAVYTGNSSTGGSGGAVRINAGTATFNGATFNGNTTTSGGGAIEIEGAGTNLTINGGSFVGNTANGSGGALILYSAASATISSDVEFRENTAGTTGGAIHVDNALFELTIGQGVQFTNNTTTAGGGGAIYNKGKLIDNGAIYTENNSGGYSGGAVRLSSCTATFTDATFTGNTTGGEGAAIYTEGSSAVTINGGSFVSNTAGNRGGALGLYGTSNVTINSGAEFRENTATGNTGGAIHLDGNASVTIEQGVQFTENIAKNGGGAIFSYGSVVDNGAIYIGNNSWNASGGAVRIEKGTASFNGATFNGNTTAYGGGAIELEGAGANLTINGGSFVDNTAGTSGGAIILYSDATATISSNAVFEQNIAANAGGAIYVDNSDFELTIGQGVQFTENVATAGGGGAIYSKGTLTDNGAIYTGNDSKNYSGGAVRIEAGTASFIGARFEGNTVTNSEGGAIYLAGDSTLTVTGGSFVGNTSGAGGALALYSTGSATINSDVLFQSNISTGGGGAIFVKNDAFELTIEEGVVFRENVAEYAGGAVRIEAGTASFTGARFEGNTSTASEGGAIYVNYLMRITVDTCVFQNNTATVGGAIYHNSSLIPGSTIENSVFTNNNATNTSKSNTWADDMLVANSTCVGNTYDSTKTDSVATSW